MKKQLSILQKPFRIILQILNKNMEVFMWIGALIFLMFVNPYETQHFSFCLFNQLGINFCPGCGIGRSISLFYHGDIIESFKMHPLGIFAFIIIVFRIIQLIKYNNSNIMRGYNGKHTTVSS